MRGVKLNVLLGSRLLLLWLLGGWSILGRKDGGFEAILKYLCMYHTIGTCNFDDPYHISIIPSPKYKISMYLLLNIDTLPWLLHNDCVLNWSSASKIGGISVGVGVGVASNVAGHSGGEGGEDRIDGGCGYGRTNRDGRGTL